MHISKEWRIKGAWERSGDGWGWYIRERRVLVYSLIPCLKNKTCLNIDTMS